MDNAIIDDLSVVEDLHAAAEALLSHALETKGGEYLVPKENHDELSRAAGLVGTYVEGEGDSGA